MTLRSLGLFLIAVSVAGCSKTPASKEPILAKVNEQIITASDLKKELEFKKRLNPLFEITPAALEDQLQTVIDRRLLIDEAKKLALDQKEPFVHSIKLFWEQTLIRDLVKQKEEIFNKSVRIEEQDLKDFYDRMSYQVSFAVKKAPDAETLTPYLKLPASGIDWDEEIGPVAYTDIDIASEVLAKAFGLAEGQMDIAQQGDQLYLVYVREKIKMTVAPYEEIKDQIHDQVREMKVQQLFRQWLEEVKAQSHITVNESLLKGMNYAG